MNRTGVRFLSLFLVLFLAFSNSSYAKTCESLFGVKKVFFTLERKKKYLKIALTVPLTTALGIVTWQKIDEHYFWPKVESKIAAQTLNVTEMNRQAYDNLIAYDFRFKKVGAMAYDPDALRIDPRLASEGAQKRFLAYNLQKNYFSYYHKYHALENSAHLTLKENEKYFGEDPLFQHLNFFLANGAEQFSSNLSDQKKNRLYMLTHELYGKYALIDLAFREKNERVLQTSNEIKKMLREPYVQRLLDFEEQNKINRIQLVYLLQEDAFHAYYFSIFETLNINEPIQLADLRRERLTEFE